MKKIDAGEFSVPASYVKIDLVGVSKEGKHYALEVQHLLVSNYQGKINYVAEGFHFGRRGPSVHLNWVVDHLAQPVEYFYNEVSVPEGRDPVGQYAMAIGCGEGYFGIQHNEESLRKVLFSIWANHTENDPSLVKSETEIKLIKQGSDKVKVGVFGNEGSGGQTFMPYDWKPGQTYKFLLRGVPVEGKNSTQFSAWFNDPEFGDEWNLIARLEKPLKSTYLKGIYSFLENFAPDLGYLERRAHYGNQWARTADGVWHEITSAKFSEDATALAGKRVDFTGGVEDGQFFLDNCGFCNDGTLPYGTLLTREPKGVEPNIDISALA
jgi:hypothetical protein